ncbi:DUF1853 family protein [Flavobacteriaceae bacterium KMM 6898]|nr:DUF1853 family protein [Flavobacteriaceae bacterium KMM 6898]
MNTENLSKFVSFLQTPPLWIGNYDGLEQFIFPHVDLERFQCSPIPENLRLGHQMEHVFLQLLESSSRYRVSAYNIPIRQNKISLGEIDFILEDLENEQRLHVELTYKFYVLDPTFPNLIHQLIGPNKRDTFYAKKEKIKHQQIPLLHSKVGDQVLKDMDIDAKELVHQVCFKAQVFLPLGFKNQNLFPLNSQCIAGYWMTKDEFLSWNKTNTQFYIPFKKEWPQHPTPKLNWKSHQDILDDMESYLSNKNSPMVWLKKSNGEMMKTFVVWWL